MVILAVMRKLLFILSVAILFSCKQEKAPDVSSIKVDLNVKRFEQQLFSIDTNNIEAGLNNLSKKYPSFLPDFLFNILGLPQHPDSVSKNLKLFIRDYSVLAAEADKKFSDLSSIQKELVYSFKLTKYYFPDYKLPASIITFIGPLEGYGSVLTNDGAAIGLQQHMGRDFPLYNAAYVREIYPAYHIRRFAPEYIPVNTMKNIVEDLFPTKKQSIPLVELMIEQGKRLFLLKKLMPNTADTLITGYTENQLKGSLENEGLIWNFFVQNDLLYQSDPFIIRDYINDGPKTAALGEASPGNIGQFVGWQIIKEYLSKHEDVNVQQLMQTKASVIFNEARYKPK